MKAFENYHPFVTLVYFLSVLSVSMFVMNPIIEITALVGALLFSLVTQKQRDVFKSLAFYGAMFFLVILTNPLFSHLGETKLFYLGKNPVTLEALLYGASIAVTIIAVMVWCRCYSEIMTSDKFLYIFGKAIPKLSLIISTALRFVPLFKRQLRKVSRAQKAMGLYSSDSFIDNVKSTGRVFISMIAWSLENAMETSSSMKARGYGTKERSNFSLYKFKLRDAGLLSVCVLLLSCVLYGAAKGALAFEYYPAVSEIEFSAISVLSFISFAVLSLLPFIIEIKEVLLWKYYISKI